MRKEEDLMELLQMNGIDLDSTVFKLSTIDVIQCLIDTADTGVLNKLHDEEIILVMGEVNKKIGETIPWYDVTKELLDTVIEDRLRKKEANDK